MNILVTGATGTLGSEIVKSCLERGYSPIALGHSEERSQALKNKFQNVPIYCQDILNLNEIENIFIKHEESKNE